VARVGKISFGLLDADLDLWAAIVGLEFDETEARIRFRLRRDIATELYLCANNSDVPSPVDVEIFAVGLAAASPEARLISPPPESVAATGPLFAKRSQAVPVAGLLLPEYELLFASPGAIPRVASGLSLRSAEPLKYERMAKLGQRRLVAGIYELAARAIARVGRVSFNLLDSGRDVWVAASGLQPGEHELRATFALDRDIDAILYICAHNSDAPAPVDVEIFAVGIASKSILGPHQ
jgi:hypothetical protein